MIIYEIKNKINNKVYIGQYSRNDFESYWGSGNLIKAAIQKYGIENFEKSILETCSTKEELDEKEKYWIQIKDSIKTGYNLTEGGTGGDTSLFIDYTDTAYLDKKSKAVKQYWDTLSNSEREDRSSKVRGEKNGMYGREGYWKGKKIPDELIRKKIESRRSYVGDANPNWKGGISKKNCKCGKEIAPNYTTCTKCRDRNGLNNPFYGKTHSEEAKEKMKAAIKENRKDGWLPGNARKISIDGIVFNSLKECCATIGLSATAMINRLKSDKYPTWFYIENYQSHPTIKAPLSN